MSDEPIDLTGKRVIGHIRGEYPLADAVKGIGEYILFDDETILGISTIITNKVGEEWAEYLTLDDIRNREQATTEGSRERLDIYQRIIDCYSNAAD